MHNRRRPRAAVSSATTPGGTRNTCSTMSESLSAPTLQQCDTATATCTITGHVSHLRATWTASDRRQHTRNATPLSHCNAAVMHASTQRSETNVHEHFTTQTIPRSAVQSHSSRSETRCSDGHATTQIRNRNIQRHSTLLARDSAGNGTPKTRIVRRAYDVATISPILTGLTTSIALPATITPQTRAHRPTPDATSPTHLNTTSASWRVSPKTAHTYKPRKPHRTLARSIQTHKP